MNNKQPLRKKHVPQRMCVACREKFEKRRLSRLVYTSAGLQIDNTGKQPGRGAYLCDNPDCWQRAHKSKILDRALRLSLSEADKQCLQQRHS